MSINFEENNSFKSRTILGQQQRPKMLDLILKTGIVKSEKKAGQLLMAIAITIFIVSIYISMRALGGNNIPASNPIVYPDGTTSPVSN